MRLAIHNGHVLGAVAFLAPIVGVYAPLGLAPLSALGAVAVIAVRWRRHGPWPVPRHVAAGILVLALAWGLASVTWGIRPVGSALFALFRLAFMFACGLALVEGARGLEAAERDTVRRWAVAGFVLALVLLGIDRVTDASIRRLYPMSPALAVNAVMENFNRGITVLGILAFPVALILWRRARLLGAAVWLATFVLALTLNSGAVQIGMALGALVALIGLKWPRRTAAGWALAAALLTLSSPALVEAIPPPDKLPPIGVLPIPNSAHHRLQIWRFTADRVGDHPMFGWGYDSSRSIPGGNKSLAIAEPALPLHPHNGMLQWWLELGVVGAVMGAALLAVVALGIRRSAPDRYAAAVALGEYSSAFCVLGLSFGIWQGWWVASLFICAAILIATWQLSESK